jgi:hypothetical protein
MTYAELEEFDTSSYCTIPAMFDHQWHTSMLDFLEDERILKFYKHPSGEFVIEEQCDKNFAVLFNRVQMSQLIKELQELLDA